MITVCQFERILFSDLCCSVLFDKRKGLVSFLSETVTKEEVKRNKIFFLVNDWLVLYWNSRFRLKFVAYQILMSIDITFYSFRHASRKF